MRNTPDADSQKPHPEPRARYARRIDWLNYHHLQYFWLVARHGSVTRAASVLRLAPPTVSAQIHRLERAFGGKLLVRRGRGLVLTELGQTAARYADQIFSLGQGLVDAMQGRERGPRRLVVGVSDVLARSIVHRILEPAFRPEHALQVVCKESRSAEAFLAELAATTIDVVLSDTPAPAGGPIRVFNHVLGECGTAWFAAPSLARRYRAGFPRSLDRAPLLLPSADSTFRRTLDAWFERQAVRPAVLAELDDVSLVAVLGEQGIGVFAAPDVLEDELRGRYHVHVVGRTREARQRFFAISPQRELQHPGVVAICERARADLFAKSRARRR